MKATISYWNLDDSVQTIASLRQKLKEEDIVQWKGIQGMEFKCWISDSDNNLWGAVMLWESFAAMNQPLPPNRAAELIGYQPQFRVTFDLEAIVYGVNNSLIINNIGQKLEER